MTPNDIFGLAITIAVGLLLVILALVLLSGRGAFLIAGYNTLPKHEQEKYDRIALCKFIGKILLPIGVLAPAVAVGGIFRITWIPAAYAVGTIVLCVFAVIYANTCNRFKKP